MTRDLLNAGKSHFEVEYMIGGSLRDRRSSQWGRRYSPFVTEVSIYIFTKKLTGTKEFEKVKRVTGSY